MAHALADEDNLRRLAEIHDPCDRGLRDIWETIVLTGRRCREVLGLRLDCIGRYRGLPMLWHDQTKVGRYDQAIRIPERLYQRLDTRRSTTLARFEDRYARLPTPAERAAMALFPTHVRNQRFDRHLSYQPFNEAFRTWVNSLELGPAVPHQARGTPWLPTCCAPARPWPTSAATSAKSATGWPSTTPTSRTPTSRTSCKPFGWPGPVQPHQARCCPPARHR